MPWKKIPRNKWTEVEWYPLPNAVFILPTALETKISLSSKFLRNLGSMPKTFTHVLSTSRKHTIGFLVKIFGECCGSRLRCWRPPVLAIKSLYSCSEICVRVGRNKSRPFTVGIGIRQGCVLSPLLFSLHQWWRNYGPPISLIRPAKYLAHFFQVPHFRLDSSATALTAACHVNHTVSGPPVARQSRIRPSGKRVWFSLVYMNCIDSYCWVEEGVTFVSCRINRESWVMTEITLSQEQAAEMGFLESTVWHFATKCAAVKFAETWMWNHFSSELRKYRYTGSAMCPECPTKDWRSKTSWLNTQKSGSEVIQGLGGATTSPTLLGPVMVWSQQNYLKYLLTVRYSKSS